MSSQQLSSAEIQTALKQLPGWNVVGGKLHKQFRFPNFVEALGWMVRVGIEAEKLGHHPDWQNVYNSVSVNLITHDLGNAISSLDITLAHKMDELYAH